MARQLLRRKRKKIVLITLAITTYNAPFFSYLADTYHDEFEVVVIYGLSFSQYLSPKISRRIKLIVASEINPFKNRFIRNVSSNPENFTHYFRYYSRLGKILARLKPDLVHCMLYSMPYTWQAAYYCKKTNTPLVITEEIQREPVNTSVRILNRITKFFLTRFVLNKTALLMSSTEQGLNFQRQFFKDMPRTRRVHMPWVVEEEKMLNAKRQKKKTGRLRILVIARLFPYKDYDTILDALLLLKRKGIKFKMDIIGSGPLEEHLRQRILNSNLKQDVELHAQQFSQEKLRSFYLTSDLLILASHYEAYGMVIPEAMSYGCAVISSDTVGAKFMVHEGLNGYTFKTGNASDLAEKIASAKRNIESLKSASRKLILNNYSSRVIVEKYVNLIRDVV